jgi:hypothetical protein
MDDEVLRAILAEIKGLRSEAAQTNARLDDTVKRPDGLRESVVVLQQGFGDIRYELRGIEDVLSERVIGQNDSVSIETKDGATIQGTIRRSARSG